MDLLGHANDWQARTARRLLQERARNRPIDPQAIHKLRVLTRTATDPVLRLQGLWSSHLIGILDEESLLSTLADPDDYLRSWAIQLAGDNRAMTPRVQQRVASMAVTDRSPVVRMYIASAIQRLPAGSDWTRVAEALVRHGEDREDRNIPLLRWQSIAPRMPGHLEEAFHLAARTQLPWLAEFIHWYAVVLDPKAADRVVASLVTLDEYLRKYSTRHRFGPTTAGPAAITLNASARAAIDFVETESRSARN